MNDESTNALVQAWRAFFSTETSELPQANLERVSQQALNSIQTFSLHSPPAVLREFCNQATGESIVLEAASLRSSGLFPSVFGDKPGQVLASRLVLNWNVLLIKEGKQLLLVFQGVTSHDAILIPGLDILCLICHIDRERVANCMAILSRTPDFFQRNQRAQFGGYLVGHTRPYHCLYDGLLALEYIRQAGMLSPNDCIYSKLDEAFLDVSLCLDLEQEHQRWEKEVLNKHCKDNNVYLLQAGFWFNTRADNQELRQLADKSDRLIREAALKHSQINHIGAVGILKHYQPLLWIGITGQKRCWVEQVDGTAEILNHLHQFYPNLGIVFDGWTPPLTSSDYHRKEIRNDDKIIQKIIRRLNFNTRKNVAVSAGLTLLEKIRVGMEVDAFLANYTTGSLAIARICGKPGVGHMGKRMMASKHQHIHHQTREPDPELVVDVSDASTPTGYVNYSIPWQALYNELIEVLKGLPTSPTRQPHPLAIPRELGR